MFDLPGRQMMGFFLVFFRPVMADGFHDEGYLINLIEWINVLAHLQVFMLFEMWRG